MQIRNKTGVFIAVPVEIRFWDKVHKTDNCWNWTGSTRGATNRQYGTVSVNGTVVSATRVSYQMAYGDFDQSLEVCHKCDNPLCVRPDHLFLGTHRENMIDASRKNRLSRENGRKGSMHGRSKLTESAVVEARKLHSEGARCRDLSAQFGISESAMSMILNRQSWTHV